MTVNELRKRISRLPADKPQRAAGKWYSTQKEHWLGWLGEYDGPGAYGRVVGQQRDAKFTYNHIVEWKTLTWLAEASGVDPKLVRRARRVANTTKAKQSGAAAVRRLIPRTVIEPCIKACT
jgi:hypothetical protein